MDGVAFVRKNVRLLGFIVNVAANGTRDQRRYVRQHRLVGPLAAVFPGRAAICVRATCVRPSPPGTCTERDTGRPFLALSMPVDARDDYDGSIAPRSRVKNKTSKAYRCF